MSKLGLSLLIIFYYVRDRNKNLELFPPIDLRTRTPHRHGVPVNILIHPFPQSMNKISHCPKYFGSLGPTDVKDIFKQGGKSTDLMLDRTLYIIIEKNQHHYSLISCLDAR